VLPFGYSFVTFSQAQLLFANKLAQNHRFSLSGCDSLLNPQKRQMSQAEKLKKEPTKRKEGGKTMGKIPWKAINTEMRQALAAIQSGGNIAWAWKVIEGHLYILSYRALAPSRAAYHDCKDLVQSVLARLQQPNVFAKVCAAVVPGQYLYKMLLNRLREEHRELSKFARSLRRLAKDILTGATESPVWQAEQKDLVEKIMELAAQVLSEDDCKALRWFYLDDLPAFEIASRLNCSESAVWKRLSRARDRIRNAYPKG
jgi:RNA polymerase sigma factor (sigma-70 family)